MKKGIHPEYRDVVFRDAGGDFAFLTRSTIKTDPAHSIVWGNGNSYPVIDLEISSASHPFYTGRQKLMDREGRVDKFRKKYGGQGTSDAIEASRKRRSRKQGDA